MVGIAGKSVVITGGAGGIGAALAARMLSLGARVTIADLDPDRVAAAADQLGCDGHVCDVTSEQQIRALCEVAARRHGGPDIFVSNAGYMSPQPGHAASASDAVWERSLAVHLMAYVYAARAVLPGMLERGSGCLVNIASAAGLLNQIGDAAYSASKQAAVSFSESLAISHGADGLTVCLVCPQYVATPMIGLSDADADGSRGLLSADDVAALICEGVLADRFLILPHPEVRDYAMRRAEDHDRWISGMQKLRTKAEKTLRTDGAGGLYKLL
ncbi:SDR family oxidoreductase [uncultured Roseobacter sp.]|uniref:SDR family NAD(P)-dependent oxidoreductase n=1 Tax=uncultured Roseobacter sp. TaxID=114847 RepID=UPI002612CD43|nr:SDR family oxidoreductase [uncultured Roseobacter sp.]